MTTVCIAFRISGEGTIKFVSFKIQPVAQDSDSGGGFGALENDGGKNRIFICGCARSGTTMMLNMMRCYKDTYCELVERHFDYFALVENDDANIVLKRNAASWKYILQVPLGIKIIYMVRNPMDVLTSKHPLDKKQYYVDISDWLGEFSAYKSLLGIRSIPDNLLVIRYEDLVSAPNEAQAMISEKWGLEAIEDFDQFHLIAAKDKASRFQAAMGKLRPPDVKSINKWRGDEQKRKYLLRLLPKHGLLMAEFLDKFGYSQHELFAQAIAGSGPAFMRRLNSIFGHGS